MLSTCIQAQMYPPTHTPPTHPHRSPTPQQTHTLSNYPHTTRKGFLVISHTPYIPGSTRIVKLLKQQSHTAYFIL